MTEPATYRETILFHARGTTSEAFEASLALAVKLCEDGGDEVASVSHSASVSWGEDENLCLYSAVVLCQREVPEEGL